MSTPIITVENLSKRYHLGQIGATTLRDSAQRLWHRLRGKNSGYLAGKFATTTSSDSGFKSQPSSLPPSPDEFWALKDVSFEVQPGEVLGIIGRNGAGKSTLLKILSRITEPTSGRTVIRGRVASLLEVGTGFHPELSGRENIFLNGAILGMKKVEIARKFDEIVSFSEVEKFIDTPVKHYSSGMYVRLAFAVAAHLEPEILIVDEVLAVGDMSFQKKCLGKMGEVAKQGRTVLFVSHNMAAISTLTSRVVWLSDGKVQEVGATDQIITDYVMHGMQTSGQICYGDLAVAPGTKAVKLASVKIISNNSITADVMIDRPIQVEYEFRVLAEMSQLVHTLHLRDKYDNIVFVSANLPSACLHIDPWFDSKYLPGVYRTTCTIPENFLNEDTYWIDVGVQDHARKWLFWEKRILSIHVHESGHMRKEYLGHWEGAVRPKLDWLTREVKKVS